MTPGEIQEALRQAQSLHRAGRLAEAEAVYERLVEAAPGNPELWLLYGVVAFQQERAEVAVERYRRAVTLRPAFPQAHNNLAVALKTLQRWDEAAASYHDAIAAKPDYAEALGNLALLHIERGRLTEGHALAARAMDLAPASPQWAEAKGTAALLMYDFDRAVDPLIRAARLAPDDADIAFELGLALEGCGDDEGARTALARASELDPLSEEFRWSEALLLPRIPRDEDEVASALRRFDEGLARIEAGLHLESVSFCAAALEAASSVTPMGLHYLPGDHTARQSRYGDIVARCVRAALPLPPVSPRPSGGRLRIGFVSSHLRDHVVSKYFADFIVKMDAGEFEKHVWSVSDTRDAVTQTIAAAVDGFNPNKRTTAQLAHEIRAATLDALIFLDAGLDPAIAALAALRLAPIQAACYGHPVTTGLDSIDYFFGSEEMETPGSDAHYRERLVRLPGLGASIETPPAAADGAWADALRNGKRPLALCLQNLSKIPPYFDRTLAAILARSGARLVVFNRGERLSARFRERFGRALEEQGLPRDALHIEPSRERTSFLGGIARADLVLDTPHFSGGATSLDAFSVGAPVLTFEGTTARGRQTFAMLKMMEIPELVVRDEDSYASAAVELLGDPARGDALRNRIRAGVSRLFNDPRPIAALQDFLRGRIRSSGA
jgi:predicted O-linked N-acetylglucosamine transferase (SPINDLY family)